MAKPKYYWMLSDGKTVRQISYKEWFALNRKNWKATSNLHLICFMDSSYIQLRKGKNFVSIPLRQLKQILNGEKVG